MEIGDIIYFLLIAVGIFGSLFKKKKKPEVASPQFEEIANEKSQPLENLVESYFPNAIPIEQEEKVVSNEPSQTITKKDPFKIKSISRPKKYTETIIFLEEEQEIKRKEIDFNLRQAVINDAILNRPKF